MLIAAGTPTAAHAQAIQSFDIPAQPLSSALQAFARQSGLQVAVDDNEIAGLRAVAVRGSLTPDAALRRLLGQTATYQMRGGTVVIRRAASADAPVTRRRTETPVALSTPRPADPDVTAIEDVIVTARRMEERIIDVPISVSAFSAEQLDERKIEGGAELLRAIPNVNFSKDNFTGYNFSIRGIGTKATSVTTDPGVAISFNNTALLRNRLFEQEYFDVQRLEVLRGPQGTLYGRNATAGVVNMLPNLPELGEFSAEAQGELGNYDTQRLRGHVNIPLGDTLALRAAGAFTKRDGFDHNTVTEQNVNGRDLWSTRVGVLWEPNSRFSANFLWEHFNEDDDRARTGKQLCTRGEAPASFDWTDPSGAARTSTTHAYWTRMSLTPGCQAASLYTDDAFGVSNGLGFPMTIGLVNITPFQDSSVEGYGDNYLFRLGVDPFGTADNRQVADLRTISTAYDPEFRAENDVFQLNLEFALTEQLTLFSQTLYMEDSYFGQQDFFRSYAIDGHIARKEALGARNGLPRRVDPYWQAWLGDSTATSGVFLDPQLGATDRFMAIDRSEAESTQWSQEFRLQSAFEGPFNFNLGANYLKYETEENYYIFSNIFTLIAAGQVRSRVVSGDFDKYCNITSQGQGKVDAGTLDPNVCTYIDPNPLDQIDGEGHNYHRSQSLAKTESWAVFGEGYWSVRDDLRLTLGLRYTDDTKTVTPVPSQLLANSTPGGAGFVGKGYPRFPDETQSWGEWTGRAVIDWKPDLPFTDDTLLYASYSRGYKGGGGNPSGREYNPAQAHYPRYAASFDPEFVDAYEIGAKNSLMDGALTFNANAFFYDYTDYQVSQIIDRGVHNENFDAKIYGAEFETAWAPSRNFRLDATLGLLKTRIGDGEQSIDVMDRLQGHDDWAVVRPWLTSPTTCVVPKDLLGRYSEQIDYAGTGPRRRPTDGAIYIKFLCPGPAAALAFAPGGGLNIVDPWGRLTWDPIADAPNESRGFAADLSGNELPNAPKMTFNIGAQYRIELPQGWDVTVRGDYYRQSDSWMRVYNNAPYDRLQSWGNANLSMTLTNPTADLVVQAYVKNVFDDTPITDGFTGPDELGNFTNVFTLDPRIIGVSVRKEF